MPLIKLDQLSKQSLIGLTQTDKGYIRGMEHKVIEALCDKLQDQQSEKRMHSPINNSEKAVKINVSNNTSPDRTSMRSNPRNYTSGSAGR